MKAILKARQLVKSIFGLGEPTVAPSNDHTDGTWSPTDLYASELAFAQNPGADALFIREPQTGEVIEIASRQSVLLFRQGTGAAPAQVITAPTDGALINIASGAEPIALIDSTNIKPGAIIRFALPSTPGVVVEHNFDKDTALPVPPNLANLWPIWLQLGSRYTTGKPYEALELQFVALEGGGYHWRDMSGFSITGSVEPDYYTAAKSQQTAVQVTGPLQIVGFADGELGEFTVYGTLKASDFTVNGPENVLSTSTPGTLSNIITASGKRIDFGAKDSAGAIFGIDEGGNPYDLIGSYTETRENKALYLPHANGFLSLGGGGRIINTAAKANQVEDL